ncbi:MAG: YncE family protein [Pirellulales bacterium]
MRYYGLLAVGLLGISAFAGVSAAEKPLLELVRTLPMPGVEGRIDHLAVDVKGRRLFVAALGNNTLEVIDLEQSKRVRSVAGLREPQGIAWLAGLGRIAVANGGDGSCRFFDARTYEQVGSIDCQDDADNLRYDEPASRLYAGCGKGALVVIDPAKMAQVATVRLAGHPESFQLESKGSRIFINVPSARRIDVIDRGKQAVVAQWPMEDSRANFPMALDESNHRLLVGCREPARLVVLDTQSGKVVATVPCVGDTDDVFYDGRLRRVYVSGGEGAVSVFQQEDGDRYRLLATVRTAAGARTSLFVPAIDRLYVAVPRRGTQGAEIREYKTNGPIAPPAAASP